MQVMRLAVALVTGPSKFYVEMASCYMTISSSSKVFKAI